MVELKVKTFTSGTLCFSPSRSCDRKIFFDWIAELSEDTTCRVFFFVRLGSRFLFARSLLQS